MKRNTRHFLSTTHNIISPLESYKLLWEISAWSLKEMKTVNMTIHKGQVYSVGNYLMNGKVLGKGHFARVEEATHRIIGKKVSLLQFKIQLKLCIATRTVLRSLCQMKRRSHCMTINPTKIKEFRHFSDFVINRMALNGVKLLKCTNRDNIYSTALLGLTENPRT